MTVVLGRQAIPEDEAQPARRASGIRSDLTWEMRRRQYHLSHVPASYPTWQQEPRPERTVITSADGPAPDVEPVRPGLMRLYAARQAHARVDQAAIRRTVDGQRLVVGEAMCEHGRVRSLAVLGAPASIGRGNDQHYRRLHPAHGVRFGRLWCGGKIMSSRVDRAPAGSLRPVSELGAPFRLGWQALFGGGMSRVGASKRMMLATLAAILVIASAASTSLAGQHRYEVREGDTIDSIAETFDVDADAIRSSSYLPDGDNLSAGQVVIIPEQGQSPGDAAQMAYENEGTSPWVAAAYWVEDGDNPASIAAEFGVSVDELMSFNGIEDPLELIPGTRVLIPDTGDSSAGGDSSGIAVPDYKQRRNLSCEYAATHAAAMSFGWAPSESDFMAAIPETLNPHYGYRGNIDGWWGNTTDYGIYPEPLVPVLADWGFTGEIMYTFGDAGPLMEHIDAGHPVVTWLGFWGDTRERLSDEGNYSVFAGMHVVTVYDYDDEGVWVMDPAKGQKVHYSWDFFTKLWTVVDGMSLAVYPS
jgi:uncharacterized protein YvpB